MNKRRKLKPFQAPKEVRRQARILVGPTPPSRPHQTPKRKPPKHKKRRWELESE